MRALEIFLLAGSLAAVCCRPGHPAPATRAAAPASPVAEIRTLVDGAGRLDWSHARDLIAFDAVGEDGHYELRVVRPDGRANRSLTAGHPDLERRHVGQPAWHPSGEYLVFQAEKAEHPRVRLPRVVQPGVGVYNDLWLMAVDSGRFFPLRQVATGHGSGVLHAHFSHDGTRLAWSEMYEPGRLTGRRNLLGLWRLMIADFSFGADGPRLRGVRPLEPGGPGFYENHGFSPDDRSLLFSSNFEGKGRLDCHVYKLDLETGELTRLTEGRGWNEHAHFSPDGRHIVWMLRNRSSEGGTDYWLMRSDGSGKRRLTYFNRKGHPHFAGETVVVADFSWAPDGASFAAYHRSGAGLEKLGSPKKLVLIRLDRSLLRRNEAGSD